MSLAEFQRAFSDLIASPALALGARHHAGNVLSGYDLDARERRRLIAMTRDPAMSINCTLFRVNRLTPLYSVLPLTCRWLGTRLSAQLDAFWAASRDATIQYGPEAWRFGEWLQDQIRAGLLSPGPIEDAIQFEVAAFEVRTAPSDLPADRYPHPRKRVVRFKYAPDVVLNPSTLDENCEPSPTEECLLLDATGEALQVYRLAGNGTRGVDP
jgi:hypothetical protein